LSSACTEDVQCLRCQRCLPTQPFPLAEPMSAHVEAPLNQPAHATTATLDSSSSSSSTRSTAAAHGLRLPQNPLPQAVSKTDNLQNRATQRQPLHHSTKPAAWAHLRPLCSQQRQGVRGHDVDVAGPLVPIGVVLEHALVRLQGLRKPAETKGRQSHAWSQQWKQ
jgi:hypothetical protein